MQDLRFQLKQALGEEKEVAEEVERVKRVLQVHLTQSVYKVLLQKSIPTQIRQRILILVIVKDKLTDLWGVDLCKTILKTLCVR